MLIRSLRARQVLDSRGNPTVEVELATQNQSASAMVPSGASTGVYEALELRDGGKPWGGKGVTKAVNNLNTKIAKAVTNKEFANQADFDRLLLALDGTDNKRKLGANALLGASMAFTRLAAKEAGLPLYQYIAKAYGTVPRLPVIFANVINGGKHSGNGLPLQEFMIVSNAKTFDQSLQDITVTYHALHDVIAKRYGPQATGIGDEGGFAPPIKTAEEALDLLKEAQRLAKTKLSFALDAASSEFYDEKKQTYGVKPGDPPKTPAELLSYYRGLIKAYSIVSLEDPFEEHSFADFAGLRDALMTDKVRCQLVGDDLTVSNPARVRDAIERHSCDCLLLKVNQIGTVTEAVQAAQLALQAGWKVMVSHRSGETDDSFISHLAVGLGTGQIKIGAPARGERVAKYNELIRISESCTQYVPL